MAPVVCRKLKLSAPVSMQESALSVAQSSDPLRPVWKLFISTLIILQFANFTFYKRYLSAELNFPRVRYR